MSAHNKATMRRYFEDIWTRGNLDAIEETLAPEYFAHFLPPQAPSGPAGFRWYVQGYRGAFPDLQAQIHDLIAEGDKVVARVTFRGTHEGLLMDIPPTGKAVTVTAMVIVRFEDGRIVEAWGEHDKFGMLQQLDVVPATP